MMRNRVSHWVRFAIAWLPASACLGADIVPPRPAATRPATAPGRGKPTAPEVVRTQEYEDVDGGTRPAEATTAAAARKPKAPWTAGDVDAAVARILAEAKTPPAPRTSDEAFLRRLSLDTIGRPPEPVTIRQFVASRAPDKRAKAIEALLVAPEFGTNWARYWRDVIASRSPNENERRVDYPEFVDWLAAKFNANVPWDQIARGIITATGRTDENGATVFAIAEEGSAVELAGEVSRVFLGIQIQCAQCHDHPSDPWKREQFHEFAAFFSGVKSKQVQRPAAGMKAVYEVTNANQARYTMPDLKNPEKKIPVAPKFFLNNAPQVSENVPTAGRLVLAARYVTDPENPWFARAFVNRVWTALVGEGFYDLVDDLGPTRTASHAEFLDDLAAQFRAHGHDVRWLYRTILGSEVYGREARSTNSAAGRVAFAANVPSRLRADQIYDALEQAFDLDKVAKVVAAAARKKGAGKAAQGVTEEKAEDRLRTVVEHAFGVDPSIPGGDVVGTIPQALYMMNSPLVTRAVQARPGTMLGQLLAAAGSPREAVEALYLRTLARRPSAKELAVSLKYLESVGNPREGFEDLLWALVNSTEFISRR